MSAIEAASISRQEDVNSQPIEQARLTELVDVETEAGLRIIGDRQTEASKIG